MRWQSIAVAIAAFLVYRVLLAIWDGRQAALDAAVEVRAEDFVRYEFRRSPLISQLQIALAGALLLGAAGGALYIQRAGVHPAYFVACGIAAGVGLLLLLLAWFNRQLRVRFTRGVLSFHRGRKQLWSLGQDELGEVSRVYLVRPIDAYNRGTSPQAATGGCRSRLRLDAQNCVLRPSDLPRVQLKKKDSSEYQTIASWGFQDARRLRVMLLTMGLPQEPEAEAVEA